MSNVNAVTGLASTTTLREFANLASGTARQVGSQERKDSVEISELAAFLSRLAELPEERARKIVEIRAAIAGDSYETPEKLDAALDRLLQDL